MADGNVREGFQADVLRFEGFAPAEEGEAYDAIVDELRGGDEVDEPVEDSGGAAGDLEEGDEGDDEDGEDAVDWDAVAGCSGFGQWCCFAGLIWDEKTYLVKILGALPSSARPKSERVAQYM